MIKIIGNGLLGSHLRKELEKDFEVFQYTRKHFTVEDVLAHKDNPLFFFGYDDFIINTVGQIPQRLGQEYNKINNLFPKYISKRASENGANFLHFSTADVFSGIRHTTTLDESVKPDPISIYGISKLNGEFIKDESMVIRTSFIGVEEAGTNYSLMSWFLKENKAVFGYKNHYWNGLVVDTLAKCVRKIVEQPRLYNPGIFHLHSPNKTCKFNLLKDINQVFNAKKDLRPMMHGDGEVARILSTRHPWFLNSFKIGTIQEQLEDYASTIN